MKLHKVLQLVQAGAIWFPVWIFITFLNLNEQYLNYVVLSTTM